MGALLIAVLIGLIVGLLARAVMPGRQDIGLAWTAVLGIAGSLVGNFIGQRVSPGTGMHWILSVLAAVALLMIFGSLTGRRRVV